MPLTTWRIYSADVHETEDIFFVETFNMFGRPTGAKRCETREEVRAFLDECLRIEPKFQYIWDSE